MPRPSLLALLPPRGKPYSVHHLLNLVLTLHSTFKPNNDADATPAQGGVSAQSTISGSTSKDVHKGLGQPVQGQSSAELRHDGQSHNKNPGPGGVDGLKTAVQGKTVDARLPENAPQRNLESDVVGGTRSDIPSAEDRVPDSA
jgi:hypothetical protein